MFNSIPVTMVCKNSVGNTLRIKEIEFIGLSVPNVTLNLVLNILVYVFKTFNEFAGKFLLSATTTRIHFDVKKIGLTVVG